MIDINNKDCSSITLYSVTCFNKIFIHVNLDRPAT